MKMELKEILSKAISKQKVIRLKVMGIGGYKATRYTFANGAIVEIGKGREYRNNPRGMQDRISVTDINNLYLKRGSEEKTFRMPLSELSLEVIKVFTNQK